MESPSNRTRSRTLTRRRFLGAVGGGVAGAAAGATGAGSLPRLGGADDETTEIATVAAGGQPIQTASVPTAWYERERHARRVLGAVRSRLADVAGVVDVSLGTDGERIGALPTSSIEVHVDPEAGVGASLPDAYDGVASRLVEAVAPVDLCPEAGGSAAAESAATEEVLGRRPAAVGGSATLHDRTGRTASATCPVRWDGEAYLMTCAHLFKNGDGSCGDVLGQDVFADAGARVGRIVGVDSAQDWVVVDNSGTNVGLENAISGVPGRLCGRVTAAGLHHLKCEGVDVFKKGQATPERRGPIRRLDVSHGGCHIGNGQVGHRYVDVDVPSKPGDSGGPIYHRFDYNGRRYLALVGVVSAEVAYTRASSAAGIHDEHGIAFAPNVPGLD